MIETYAREGIEIVVCRGVVKLGESAREFSQVMSSALAKASKGVIVDMTYLNYLDSTGIGELVGYLTKAMSTGKVFAIAGLHPPISGLFGKPTELRTVFPAFTTVDDAVAALRSLSFEEYMERSGDWVYRPSGPAAVGA